MGISHSWNGTVLTITSDSGTSSADLKGDTGIRGPQGPAGDQYKPQYGLDYFTEAEKDAFLAEIDEHIEANKDELFMGEVRSYVDQTTVNAEYVDEYVNNYVRENAVNAAYVESYVGANAVNSADVSNYVSANAAPSGFGLGEAQMFSMSDIDSITKPGFYYCNESGTIAGFSNSRWWMIVKAYGTGSTFATQELYSFTSDIAIKLVRHKTNATWREWGFENPPMFAGVEYRTTEKWNGKVVYTKRVNCGELPSGNTQIYWGLSKTPTNIVRTNVTINTNTMGSITLPYIYGDITSSYTAVYAANYSQLLIVCGANATGQAYAQIWYTVN